MHADGEAFVGFRVGFRVFGVFAAFGLASLLALRISRMVPLASATSNAG